MILNSVKRNHGRWSAVSVRTKRTLAEGIAKLYIYGSGSTEN